MNCYVHHNPSLNMKYNEKTKIALRLVYEDEKT